MARSTQVELVYRLCKLLRQLNEGRDARYKPFPLVIGQESSLWTVQVVLSSSITEQAINLLAFFMGAVVAVVPLLLIFFLLQNYIVEGVARSGIKD